MKKIIVTLLLMSLILMSCTPTKQVESKEPEIEKTTEATKNVTYGINPGDLAADFTIKDLKGNDVTLSKLKGSPVLLVFWATSCPFCLEEVPMVDEYQKAHPELKALAVNIDIQTDEFVKQFAEEKKLSLPVLFTTEEDYKSLEPYSLRYIPFNVFIDKDGFIVEAKAGPITEKDLDRFLEGQK
ncbi:TlpA family protein disulfide reductase [Guggenheimella bovis]